MLWCRVSQYPTKEQDNEKKVLFGHTVDGHHGRIAEVWRLGIAGLQTRIADPDWRGRGTAMVRTWEGLFRSHQNLRSGSTAMVPAGHFLF